jgi:hypothetical protein
MKALRPAMLISNPDEIEPQFFHTDYPGGDHHPQQTVKKTGRKRKGKGKETHIS